jgi:hypothetical protein
MEAVVEAFQSEQKRRDERLAMLFTEADENQGWQGGGGG